MEELAFDGMDDVNAQLGCSRKGGLFLQDCIRIVDISDQHQAIVKPRTVLLGSCHLQDRLNFKLLAANLS